MIKAPKMLLKAGIGHILVVSGSYRKGRDGIRPTCAGLACEASMVASDQEFMTIC